MEMDMIHINPLYFHFIQVYFSILLQEFFLFFNVHYIQYWREQKAKNGLKSGQALI